MTNTMIETMYPKRFSWLNALFLGSMPILAIGAAVGYSAVYGFKWSDLIPFFVMYLLTGFAMTAGYHRYYSHRAYECLPLIRILFLTFGAAALQNSVLNWVSDHRYHHRYEDQEEDPYNINKGFFWAHIGWVLWADRASARPYDNVKDLKKDRWVMFQYKYYWPLAIFMTATLPILIGACFGRPMAGLIWGFMIRVVFVHHIIFLVNSAAHTFGSRPFSTKSTARDHWLVGILALGEGYHNFHHAFPSDYRNGIAWYDLDPTKWLINGMKKMGWAFKLRQTSDSSIQAAREKTRRENLATDEQSFPHMQMPIALREEAQPQAGSL